MMKILNSEMFFEISDYLLNNDYEEAGEKVKTETCRVSKDSPRRNL